jgi:hypothetical protein
MWSKITSPPDIGIQPVVRWGLAPLPFILFATEPTEYTEVYKALSNSVSSVARNLDNLLWGCGGGLQTSRSTQMGQWSEGFSMARMS